MRPQEGSFDVYVDADFAGNWNQKEADKHNYTARSRHGYVVMFAKCPILWASQLQTEVALSSTESEFIGLYMAMRTTISLMELVKELKAHDFNFHPAQPTVH